MKTRRKNIKLTADLQKQFTSQKVLLNLLLVTTASRIKTGEEIFISEREPIRSVTNIGTDPDE